MRLLLNITVSVKVNYYYFGSLCLNETQKYLQWSSILLDRVL